MSSRPLSWVASILYIAVLAAGGYFQLTGGVPTSPVQSTVFVGGLIGLLLLEAAERRHHPERTSLRLAAGLLALRSVLYVVISTVDTSGFARVLFLLVPFAAYFTLGPRVSYALAALCLGLVVLRLPGGWYRDQEILSDLLMFGIGLVLAVAMASVAVQAQRYAGQVATLAAEAERSRLARDLHDSLGHHLTAISVQLEKAAAFRHRDEAMSAQALADARASARYALADVRHSVGSLRGGTFSLRAALTDLVRTDSTVALHAHGDESGYPSPSLLALYRVAQEGLTNARRHAAAGQVTVRLELGADIGRLVVADNGRGFHVDDVQSGFGLRGMRERLELLGGSLAVRSAPGSGTQVTATVPVPR